MAASLRSPGGRFLAVSWAKKAVKLSLLPAGWLRRERRPGLFVLIYHRVGAGMGQEMDVAEDVFRAQMRLVARRFEPVTLEEGASRLAEGIPLPRDLVAVTFDDGYRDVHRRAWPILAALRVPATLFLATAFLDGEIPAPIRRGRGRGEDPLPLAWDEVREMVASGIVSVGSHSHTHREFDALTPDEAFDEVRRSKEILEERLDRPVESFAYPRAVVSHEDVVAAAYRYAVTGDGAKNPAPERPGSAPRRLSRTPIRASDGMAFFRARLAGVDPLEDRLYSRIRAGVRR